MELYVCWGTFSTPKPGGHPCRNAHRALTEAGWTPEVKKTYGYAPLPSALNPGRGKVRELSGQQWVPVLVTGDGEVIRDSERIVAWAQANPASGAETVKP